MDKPIAVRYRCLTDTRMHELAESWDDLVAVLSEHRETTDKFSGPLWSPVVPATDGLRKRCNAAVAAVSALVLDVDDGTPLETVTAQLDGEWIAYSTWSHTDSMPRYHVVVRLADPVPVEQWRGMYEQANGGLADWLPAVSHAYFLPEHAAGAPWFVRRSA